MKKVLKQQEKELEAYVKAKHTQEECIGFIDGFERANELFALYNVSQRSELLAFLDWVGKNTPSYSVQKPKQIVQAYLKANCG